MKGRSKSFEITLVHAGSSEKKLLWSGIKIGPPRKLKFPSPSEVVEMLQAEIKTDTTEEKSDKDEAAAESDLQDIITFEHCKS